MNLNLSYVKYSLTLFTWLVVHWRWSFCCAVCNFCNVQAKWRQSMRYVFNNKKRKKKYYNRIAFWTGVFFLSLSSVCLCLWQHEMLDKNQQSMGQKNTNTDWLTIVLRSRCILLKLLLIVCTSFAIYFAVFAVLPDFFCQLNWICFSFTLFEELIQEHWNLDAHFCLSQIADIRKMSHGFALHFIFATHALSAHLSSLVLSLYANPFKLQQTKLLNLFIIWCDIFENRKFLRLIFSFCGRPFWAGYLFPVR